MSATHRSTCAAVHGDPQRGTILFDFLQGSMIFVAFSVIFFTLAQGKLDLLATASFRTVALEAAAGELERVVAQDPRDLAATLGAEEEAVSRRFPVEGLAAPTGDEAGVVRIARVPEDPALLDVEVIVTWRTSKGNPDQVRLGSRVYVGGMR